MKKFKVLMATVALVIGPSLFAAAETKIPPKGEPISVEIQKMLQNSGLIIEEEVTLKMLFTISSDKRIEILRIFSADQDISVFLEERLSNRKLYGDKWITEKIYELPVRVQMKK